MSSSEVASDLSPLNGLWKAFASVKLTIVLLLTLAATSIIGTLIPQNETPVAYVQAFGEFGYRLFALLGVFDMYSSWWFRSLILLLTANIVVCSIDRLQFTWKIIFARHPKFNIARFRRFKRKEEFKAERAPDRLKNIYPSIVARRFGYHRVEDTDEGFAVYGESGRWTRLGVYIVHFSVVLLLIGGLIGSIFGFDGFVNIPEGESVRTIQLRNNPKKLQLDFEVRCDDFNVTFYDTGAPKEFRSSLTILKQGKPVYQKDIIVNDPLQYEGIRFFQSSYGNLPPNEVMLNFTSKATGMNYSQKAAVNKQIVIPGNLGTFALKQFTRAADFRGQNIGEAFIGVLTPPNGSPVEVTLPLRFPRFDRMRKGDVVIAIADYLPRYYTGLQVSRDPGVWVVYTGFILMIIGIYITFFMSHKQVCVAVTADGKKSRIMVAGTANKNKLGMENKVSNLSEKLAETESNAKGEAKN
ncbi:MAG: cytochrome c biogenesis protein ResB [Desulfobacterales bacterium]|nr:cytochrome c biogenesis protein ResB [Desulfobacterales bacterium]